MNENTIKCLENGKYEDLVWLNMEPDDEMYTPEQAGDALDRLRKEHDLLIDWNGQTIDFGSGHCEMYSVEGNWDDVVDAELVFYELCEEEAEKKAEKEEFMEYMKKKSEKETKERCDLGGPGFGARMDDDAMGYAYYDE